MEQKRYLTRNIVVATRNQGKLREIERLLTPFGYEVRDLSSFEGIGEIVEDGSTFEENALKKALEVQKHVPDSLVLADDSGLCVDSLGGEPGVYSARYAGESAADGQNNDKLLEALQGFPLEERGARFVCVLVLVGTDREPIVVRGECEGYIALEPAGGEGFGYDPLFYLPEHGCTMAELSLEQKNAISHRAQALGKLKNRLV
jgi:XTP/dITP diphosphohydrolase